VTDRRAPTTAFEVRAVLDAPPSQVYGLLDDSATWPSWTPIDEHTPVRPPGPDGLGEVRRFRNGRYVLTEEIVAREPDRRLAYRLLTGLAVTDYRADIELEPHGAGTALRWHTRFSPHRARDRSALPIRAAHGHPALRRRPRCCGGGPARPHRPGAAALPVAAEAHAEPAHRPSRPRRPWTASLILRLLRRDDFRFLREAHDVSR
jgi:uncharacterized protein YndB with AHSA1/START domain